MKPETLENEGKVYENFPELSRRIRKSRAALYMNIKAGKIPAPIKIGGSCWFDREAVNAAIFQKSSTE